MTILDTLTDPALFAPFFSSPTWHAWQVFLASLFGLPIAEADVELFAKCTGRTTPQTTRAREGWLVVGRRGGKSRIAALVAVFIACFFDHRPHLSAGEVGTVAVIAADRRQARVVLRYIKAFLDAVPMLRAMVVNETRESIELNNGVVIEVHTASFRLSRGYSLIAVICDEIAFWRTEDSANPDTEILAALRPGMATIPGALLLAISSPYARVGSLWTAYKDHFAHDGDPVFVWQASTETMNENVDAQVIADAYEADEASAAAEYGAQFRRDIEAYVSREALDAVTIPGRRELAPVSGIRYHAFVDPSGGSQDSMTLGVAHAEAQDAAEASPRHGVVSGLRYQLAPPDDLPRRSASRRVILDCIREKRAPFSPQAVVAEFADTLRAYGVSNVVGDRYSGEWCREAFRNYGISYTPSEKPKSALYAALLPLINSQRVELLDVRVMLNQLASLGRRTTRAGADSIDHGPGARDDAANACAGVVVLAEERSLRREIRTVRYTGI